MTPDLSGSPELSRVSTHPLRARKKNEAPESARERAPGADDATRRGASRAIVCASCGHRLTDGDAAIEVAGRHHHTCVNPAGIVFRIRCFRTAPGAAGRGDFTDAFSWFAGYAWQVATCAACGAHVGWGYRGSGAPFHGLIADRIAEQGP
jgi:hypothetical protein